jgi:microcystin-dependent protein
MSEPFLGQIQSFGFGFAPKNWALCNGQLLSIQQNAALFSLLGTAFGGNGTTTFGLPNLQSRVPLHFGNSPAGNTYVMGEAAGEEQVTLSSNQMPQHIHMLLGTSTNGNAFTADPGQILAQSAVSSGTALNYYSPDATLQPLNPASVLPTGNGLPHSNIQPYLTINWCIALRGIFPSRN